MKPERKILTTVLVLFFMHLGNAGADGRPELNKKGSHEAFIDILNNSNITTFFDIVRSYDRYISAHPNEVTPRIEACKFLRYAMEGESVPYDTASALFDLYNEELISRFPGKYDVILFRSTEEGTDDAIALLEDYLKANEQISTDDACWELFEQLARLYAGNEQPYKSIHYGVIAERLNDTLDITLLLAEQCEKAGDKKTAVAYLKKFPGRSRMYYDHVQRGELLFKLGEFKSAAEEFSLAVALEDYEYARLNLSKALMELGKYEEARAALTGRERSPYYKETFLRTLFDLDMRYGSADSALQSYNAMRDLGIYTDPFGKYRFALFLHHPLVAWQFRDAGGLLLFLAMIVFFCLLPALLILPVHYIGLVRKVVPPEDSRWNLKHLWIIIAVMFVSSFIVTLVFEYGEVIEMFGSNVGVKGAPADSDKAWLFLLDMFIVAGSWLVFMRRNDLVRFWGTKWSKAKSIGAGIGWMFIVRIVFAIIFYTIIFLFQVDISSGKGYDLYTPLTFDIGEYIIAFKETFGWFALAIALGIITPISEEVIFRGVALRSMQRYIPFAWANLLQSILFAVIHLNPTLMLNAFLMGLTAGVLRNRSSSLAPGIALHMGNNLLVVGFMMLQSFVRGS